MPDPAQPGLPPLLNGADTRLRYVNTRADILRGTLYATARNRALLWYMAVLITIVTWLSVRDYLARGYGPVLIIIAVVIQLLMIAVLLVVGLTIVTLLGLHLNKGRGVVGEHELEITETGLVERTDFNESLHKWKGLGEIRETAQLHMIRVSEGGGAFHLVPKSGLILEGNPGAFVARVKEMKARVTAASSP